MEKKTQRYIGGALFAFPVLLLIGYIASRLSSSPLELIIGSLIAFSIVALVLGSFVLLEKGGF